MSWGVLPHVPTPKLYSPTYRYYLKLPLNSEIKRKFPRGARASHRRVAAHTCGEQGR